MRTNIIIFVLGFLCIAGKAQFSPYQFSSIIDSSLRADTTPFKYQMAGTAYSYIGEYKLGLETRDREYKNTSGEPTESHKALLAPFNNKVNVASYILEQAAKTSIVIFNEAHHNPRHRVFVATLLPELKKLGYTYIGLEALPYSDSNINVNKYPSITPTSYTNEPCFGNLLREALQLGYTVFPYEADWELQKKGESREELQARNIKAIIDKYPNNKFIIYCGYDHAIEDSTRNFMVLPMAGRLKKMTGIDPFTIDQVQLTESSSKDYGNRYRKLISHNESIVLKDNEGNVFNKAKNNLVTFDCNVYHPDTKYINNRPDWLYTKDKKAIYIYDKINIAYPCLVKVYRKKDCDNAVPLDVIELLSPNDNKALVVPNKGKKRIVVTNKLGESLVIFE